MQLNAYNLFRKMALACALVTGISATADAQYCTPTWSSGCGVDYISNFGTSGGITNISQSSGCGTPYIYYPTQIHTALLNSTVNFTYTNGADAEYYKIWVDWNGDQTYQDPAELVYTTGSTKISGSSPVTGSFTVPPTATPGTTRLRIRCNYSNNTFTPCSAETWGEAEEYPFVINGTPCTPPSAPNATNITSKTATLSWTGPSGVSGYEYFLDQTATPPATGTPTFITGTTFNASGLTPSTTYWLHVRTKCNATSISQWVNYSFTTLPPCQPPVGFKTVNLQTTSTTVSWKKWPSAITYDYVVDQTRVDPGATTGAVNTVDTFANLTGLTENTWYYVHIRSLCAGNEKSNWSLDSFITPVPCRAPQVKIDHINTHDAVSYWEPVPSAQWYEYAITQMSLPPVSGTKYNYTSLHTSALNDGEGYFMHVRCFCISVGVESYSPWGSATFDTWATAISNVNGAGQKLEVYPNPVKSILTVKLAVDAPAGAMLSITDVTGKTVKTMELKGKQATVDMGSLAEGLYLVKYTDGVNAEVIKITKQ